MASMNKSVVPLSKNQLRLKLSEYFLRSQLCESLSFMRAVFKAMERYRIVYYTKQAARDPSKDKRKPTRVFDAPSSDIDPFTFRVWPMTSSNIYLESVSHNIQWPAPSGYCISKDPHMVTQHD